MKRTIKFVELTSEEQATEKQVQDRLDAHEKEVSARLTPQRRKFLELKIEISRTINRVLEEKQLSQKQMAKNSGLTEAAVSHLLMGERNPTLETLSRISAALGEDILLTPEMACEHVFVKSKLYNTWSNPQEMEFSYLKTEYPDMVQPKKWMLLATPVVQSDFNKATIEPVFA